MRRRWSASALASALVAGAAGGMLLAQQPPMPGPQGRGGPAFGGVQEERRLVAQFDRDRDGRLNRAERDAARAWLAEQPQAGRGRGPGGRGLTAAPPEPGRRVSPAEVRQYGREPLYDPDTLRTVFLDFEHPDWERELSAFYGSDVEVPAALTVDGRTYRDVGVHFRGASSFFTVPEGRKRSLNLTIDFVHDGQALGGYRTLNLLNSHTDPTFLRAVLYYEAARGYIPAPRANFVHVVINGESWGIYVNAQQFNREFVREWFQTTDGARWKVPGSPNGRGGLTYLGEDPAAYRRLYEIKTKDDPEAWAALVRLCRVLDQTPPDRLETALEPLLDIDGALRFLALENALINADGYWVRASDYNIYLDRRGRFHVIPHDANETFRGAGGPGGPGGPGGRGGPGGPPPRGLPAPPAGFGPPGSGPGAGRGVELDPFTGADDPSRPLLSKLLAVPALRARYAGFVRDIAGTWLDWTRLEPKVTRYQALIASHVKAETRALDTYERFEAGPDELRRFVEARRAFLLEHPGIRGGTR